MSKLFYEHLINMNRLKLKLDEYSLSDDEKKELLQSIDATIHHEVMNVILKKLPNDYHEEFLEGFTSAPHQHKHLEYLRKHSAGDIEKELRLIIVSIEDSIISEL